MATAALNQIGWHLQRRERAALRSNGGVAVEEEFHVKFVERGRDREKNRKLTWVAFG